MSLGVLLSLPPRASFARLCPSRDKASPFSPQPLFWFLCYFSSWRLPVSGSYWVFWVQGAEPGFDLSGVLQADLSSFLCYHPPSFKKWLTWFFPALFSHTLQLSSTACGLVSPHLGFMFPRWSRFIHVFKINTYIHVSIHSGIRYTYYFLLGKLIWKPQIYSLLPVICDGKILCLYVTMNISKAWASLMTLPFLHVVI